jgi:hypothetical protein
MNSIVNIQLNSANYTAQLIYVAGSNNDSTPTNLIVECLDPNSNIVYIAIPLKQQKDPVSDVHDIINATGGNVNLTLNNYIKTNGNSVVQSPNNKNGQFPITITLDAESEIPIDTLYPTKKFYQINSIPGINISSNPTKNTNAKLQQQDLDWVMTCDLLTEDGPTERQSVELGSTATIISFLMMTIMVVIVSYYLSPIVYNELGLYKLASSIGNNHLTLNFYWSVTLVLVAVASIVQGIRTKNLIYWFVFPAAILSYLAGTMSVLKIEGVANSTGWFNGDEYFKIYYEIVIGTCSILLARIVKICGILVLLSAVSGMFLSTNDIIFMSSVVLFLLLSFLMLTAVSYLNIF